jgi:site-specific DNA recombinase
VVRIFREYAGARSPREIARRLNAEGVPGPGGRPWGDTTIRGHALRGTGLLHNEIYVGRLVWNRQRYMKDPKTARRVARLNPKSAWVVRDVRELRDNDLWELRIVDNDLWQAVQARLASTRQSPGVAKAIATEFWKQRRPRHLLTGLAHCAFCGKPLAAVGRDYLACGAARRQGTCAARGQSAASGWRASSSRLCARG